MDGPKKRWWLIYYPPPLGPGPFPGKRVISSLFRSSNSADKTSVQEYIAGGVAATYLGNKFYQALPKGNVFNPAPNTPAANQFYASYPHFSPSRLAIAAARRAESMPTSRTKYIKYVNPRGRGTITRVIKKKYPRKRRGAGYRTGGYMNIGGRMSQELNFLDTSLADRALVASWTAGELDNATSLTLGAPAQGTTESTHTGNKYWIHSLYVRGIVRMAVSEDQTEPPQDVSVRLLIVWDLQTNGAQLEAEQVMLINTAVDNVDSMRHLEHSSRFVVLWDKRINLYADGISSLNNNYDYSGRKRPFMFYKKFKKPIKVRTKSTGSTVADITDNSLHMIGCSTTIGTSATLARIQYQSRIRFTS